MIKLNRLKNKLTLLLQKKWPFVILTSYLEGRKVNLKRDYKYVECKKWEYVVAEDYKLCYDTLTSLNCFGIWHGDARTSNFVIVYDQSRQRERAKILDFGFSQRSTTLTENLKDDEMS
jgi:tRNA A-37 threonylcarbamoyl transferase component Bud32